MRSRVVKVREAEVDYFDVASMRYEDVFDFEITMDDVVTMTILQSGANLSRELSCNPLTEATVRYYVVKHLTTVNVLEDHIIMVLVNDHLPHTTNVRVMQKKTKGSLANSSDLFGCVFTVLLGYSIWGHSSRARRMRRARHYFDGELCDILRELKGMAII